MPGLATFLPVGGLILNLLLAWLGLFWAYGCLGEASAMQTLIMASYGVISAGRVPAGRASTSTPGLLSGHSHSAQAGDLITSSLQSPGPRLPSGRSSSKLPELDQPPAWGAWLGRDWKVNLASPGGCLLQAASEVPLKSLLNHLPHKYSWRAGREEEPYPQPPAPRTLEIAQPAHGPGWFAEAADPVVS